MRAQEPAPFRQEAEANDKEAAPATAVLRRPRFEDATLSLEEQLPYLRIRREDAAADEYSPPNLLVAIEPTLTHFRTTFVEVRQLYFILCWGHRG